MAAALRKIEGVKAADVSYEKRQAVVTHDPGKPKLIDALVKAIKDEGFKPGAPRSG